MNVGIVGWTLCRWLFFHVVHSKCTTLCALNVILLYSIWEKANAIQRCYHCCAVQNFELVSLWLNTFWCLVVENAWNCLTVRNWLDALKVDLFPYISNKADRDWWIEISMKNWALKGLNIPYHHIGCSW